MRLLKHTNRGGRRRTSFLLLGVSSLLVASTGLVGANAGAATTTSGSLVFTGALKGTLKLGPNSGCDASNNGVTLSSFTTTLPSKKFKTWSVTIFVSKLGTYKKFKLGNASFVLGTSNFTGWVATKGSMTIIANSGTVNLTLGGHEGEATGTVHVAGTWTCGS
ncbi:MAG: hypothetical protein WAN30_06370 [Acidimicrobiales bacterium]